MVPTFSQSGSLLRGRHSGIVAYYLVYASRDLESDTNTASAGSTIYTFTPTPGVCATTTTMTVQVNATVVPTFAQLGPLCRRHPGIVAQPPRSTASQGPGVRRRSLRHQRDLQRTSPPRQEFVLPRPHDDGAGECHCCANVCPVGADCVGATPGLLPTTSSTASRGPGVRRRSLLASAGSTVYTFTPADETATIPRSRPVQVSETWCRTFSQLGALLCGRYAARISLTISTNGITGTWSPTTVTTAAAGSTVYTFTPAPGVCATTTTMTVQVNENVAPTFTQLGPYCVGATPGLLPTTNGITGTWSPTTVTTGAAGSTVYTFTPTPGVCASTTTMTVQVNENVAPTFSQSGPYGRYAALITNNLNQRHHGTWSPTTSTTAAAGSTVYTFTPAPGSLCYHDHDDGAGERECGADVYPVGALSCAPLRDCCLLPRSTASRGPGVRQRSPRRQPDRHLYVHPHARSLCYHDHYCRWCR